jgi:hypothetical protein
MILPDSTRLNQMEYLNPIVNLLELVTLKLFATNLE